ncbi:imidazoleglycerol-phosphate dehydratase [Cyclonatronum proteinivorum]|uniref:Imidazoleglycerol-phosphate dehydratase n=1 Tax=Cyclonatronum proteinivorum TaxID=1457365 RepID=A0A345UMB0_9BACT|nr:imidazoleglycerol-phosphate dehydratase HisB [Cyclonatronum proteinivorum]AXJ01612.1 imidazoleglycerol-phosphate dehydratase [Cyclonatronum proteinivorum]
MSRFFISAEALSDGSELRPFAFRALIRLHEAGAALLLDAQTPQLLIERLRREDLSFELTEAENPALSGTRRILAAESGLLQQQQDGASPGTAPDWQALLHQLLFPPRIGRIRRTTRETDIEAEINLDGSGKHDIKTGLGFFDHMLEQIARHGDVDLRLHCKGDLHIDEHHTIEDCALALGDAISAALGDKRGITRYASVLPMDETRAMTALDLSGRPYLVFDVHFSREKVGDVPTEMVKHFFYSLAMNTKSTLHFEVTGENDHHKIEAMFKGFAIVLKQSVKRTGSLEIPSSKGIL